MQNDISVGYLLLNLRLYVIAILVHVHLGHKHLLLYSY